MKPLLSLMASTSVLYGSFFEKQNFVYLGCFLTFVMVIVWILTIEKNETKRQMDSVAYRRDNPDTGRG